MQKRCKEKKRHDKGLQLCLPRKPQSTPPPRSTYTQATARPTPRFHFPRRPRPLPMSPTAQRGVPYQKPSWYRKYTPSATVQTDPPTPHPFQGARRKKAVRFGFFEGWELTSPHFQAPGPQFIKVQEGTSSESVLWAHQSPFGPGTEEQWREKEMRLWCTPYESQALYFLMCQ